MKQIDINCDMGEGMSNEQDIIPLISSISIACGGHTGNVNTMRETIQLAKKFSVSIGAHPSYPDTINFGRVKMQMDESSLRKSIIEQIQTLVKIANEENYPIKHVKPHGALYNEAAKDYKLAELIGECILAINPTLSLWGLPQSALEKAAATLNIHFVAEGFADRTYQADGSLTPRTASNALITNEAECLQQVGQLITENTITATNGQVIDCKVQTICIHGDGPNALTFARAINHYLHKQALLLKSPHESA